MPWERYAAKLSQSKGDGARPKSSLGLADGRFLSTCLRAKLTMRDACPLVSHKNFWRADPTTMLAIVGLFILGWVGLGRAPSARDRSHRLFQPQAGRAPPAHPYLLRKYGCASAANPMLVGWIASPSKLGGLLYRGHISTTDPRHYGQGMRDGCPRSGALRPKARRMPFGASTEIECTRYG